MIVSSKKTFYLELSEKELELLKSISREYYCKYKDSNEIKLTEREKNCFNLAQTIRQIDTDL